MYISKGERGGGVNFYQISADVICEQSLVADAVLTWDSVNGANDAAAPMSCPRRKSRLYDNDNTTKKKAVQETEGWLHAFFSITGSPLYPHLFELVVEVEGHHKRRKDTSFWPLGK